MSAQIVRANGIGVRYLIEGPADAPVVVFEGLSGNCRILRYDLRGHGGTKRHAGRAFDLAFGRRSLCASRRPQLQEGSPGRTVDWRMIAQSVAATAEVAHLLALECPKELIELIGGFLERVS
jgi:pimeloyl-ACP methyl ester carboxylesterase